MSDAKKIMDMIKENDITFVDLRFTDPRGKMQHVTQHIDHRRRSAGRRFHV